MDINHLLENCSYQIQRTIAEFGVPDGLRFELANNFCKEIAKCVNADLDLVQIGLTFIDLGAWKSDRTNDPVPVATVKYIKEILDSMVVDENLKEILFNNLKSYYDNNPKTVEANVISDSILCAYIHPSYVLHSLVKFIKSGQPYLTALKTLKFNTEQAYNSISLNCTKEIISKIYNETINNLELNMKHNNLA